MKKSCLKILSTILFFSCISLSIKDLNAGIYFISKETSVEAQNNIKPCQLAGYTKTDAECKNLGLKLSDICSTDGRYGKSCACDETQFKYTTTNCSSPKVLSGDSCNGKYNKCDCDTSVYKYYINSDCPTNKIIDSTSACTYANNKVGYSKCACPSQYSTTCTGNLEGVGTVCDSKYISCKCKSNFIDCGSQKGAAGSTSCVDSTGTKYTSCQPITCESASYLSAIPTNNNCTAVSYNGLTCYKDCKNKTCTDGGYLAAIPTNNNCTAISYSGLTCYKDCKAKTCADGGYLAAIPTNNNCTAVSYSGLTCYKDCKASCNIYKACPYVIPSANVYNNCVSCGFTPGNFTQTTCDGITYGKCEGCPPGFADCTIPMTGHSVDSNKCEVKAGGSPEKKCVRIANGQTSCSPCNYCKLSGSSCN